MDFGQFVFTSVIYFLTKFNIFVHSFNLDTENPTIYKGPNDSYFGYTTAILRNKEGIWQGGSTRNCFVHVPCISPRSTTLNFSRNASLEKGLIFYIRNLIEDIKYKAMKENRILTGAPRGKDIYQPFVRRPGALYKCPYPTGNPPGCTQVNVDSTGETRQKVVYHGRNITFHHQKEDQWLGVSLDVDHKNHSSVLICAHRWTDSYIQRKMGGITHMNGMCYVLDGDLDEEGRLLPALTVTERLVSRQRFAEFSMGSLGMASVIAEEQMLMTAPGLNDWSGGLAIEVTTSKKPAAQYIEPPRKFHQDSYIGYSLAVGMFVYRNTKCVALGAPRVTKVFVYSLSANNSPLNTKRPIAVIRERQIGSYFGASVVSLDVNRDGMDDIIVGAPMFADGGIEQGRVFIFISKGIVGFQRSSIELTGENESFARFGTSIAVLGDANQDDFTDIAVGAPYQDIHGAVFIYNGYKNGIYPKYTQLIYGKAIDTGLSGFGTSFSRPYDINNDGIKDISIGAYSSGHVAVFRGRPVVDMKVIYHFYPNKISQNSTCRVIGRTVLCFQVQLCFFFKYKTMASDSDQKVELTYMVKSDSNQTLSNKRAVLIDISDYRIQHVTSFQGNVTVTNDEITCSLPKMVYIKQTSIETLDPIEFEASIDMKSTNCQLCPLLSTFHGHSDSPLDKQTYKGMVPFEERCKYTENCESILTVKGGVKTTINKLGMLYTSTDYVELDTTIKNLGDMATSLSMTQIVSRGLIFHGAVDSIGNKSVSCVPYYNTHSKNVSTYAVHCFLGNLRFQRFVRILTSYYCKNSSADFFHVKTSVSTKSRLSSNSNTSVAVAVPLLKNPSVMFTGVPVPEEHIFHTNSIFKQNQKHVSHIYTVYNEGPVTLTVGTLFLYHQACSTQIKIMKIETRIKGDASIHCIRQELPLQNSSRHRMNTQPDVLLAICLVQNLTTYTSVHINTTMDIGFENIRNVSMGNWNFTTTARFVQNSEANVYSNVDIETNVTTIITVVSWDIIDAPMKYWIFMMSSFCGLMVILVLSILLWKCGFFARKDRDLFQRLVQRRNLLLARHNPSESDNLLDADSSSETIVMTASSRDSSSETMVMTPPPSYREVNSFCSNSRSSTHTDTTKSSGSEGYLEPIQTTV